MAEHGELLVTVRNKVALLASLLDSALDHCFGDHDWFPLADEHSIAYGERASALSGQFGNCESFEIIATEVLFILLDHVGKLAVPATCGGCLAAVLIQNV